MLRTLKSAALCAYFHIFSDLFPFRNAHVLGILTLQMFFGEPIRILGFC